MESSLLERKILTKRERKLSEAVKEIERKYGISITPEDIEHYLVGFAGRILDYTKQKLPGIFLDSPDGVTLVRWVAPAGINGIDDLQKIAEMNLRPDIHIRNAIEYISYFYTHSIRK